MTYNMDRREYFLLVFHYIIIFKPFHTGMACLPVICGKKVPFGNGEGNLPTFYFLL